LDKGVCFAVPDSDAVERTTAYAIEQRKRLKKVLRTRDLVLFTTSGIIGIDTIAQSATNGVQAIFWILFSCIFFAIPYAFIAAEMGSTYVKNGGLYVWIKEAYNPYIASIVTFMYWLSNPIWAASLVVEAVGIIQSLLGVHWSNPVQFILALLLIWLVAGLEITYLNVGKWLPNIGAVIKVVLLIGLGLMAIAIVLHHDNPANSFAFSHFLPTKAVAIAYLPVLMYQWQGFELQSNAAQEMVNPRRDVPVAILWSVVLSALGYTLGVLGILLVIPLDKMSNVSGLFDAFKTITPGSWILGPVAILIVIGLLASGTTWLLGVDRAFAASGYDGNIPKSMGHMHRKFGTPDRVAVIGAVVSSLVLALNLFVTGGALETVYSTLLNLAVLNGSVPYLLMFPALLILRKRYPNVKRPFQIPGGMAGAWIAVLIGLIWIGFTLVFVYIPGPSVSDKPLYIKEMVYGTLIAFVVASLLFWAARRDRRQLVQVSLVDQDD
jgi:glutamate:GABA antiporter